MDTNKTKKNIRSIMFSGKKVKTTVIDFGQSFTPKGHNDSVEETPTFRSTMARHKDFDKAMARMGMHLLMRYGFIDSPDDDKIDNVEVAGVIITTKKDLTGFQILGKYETEDGQFAPLKSPVISTLAKNEGFNYPYIEDAQADLERLLTEADEFMKYKSGAAQLKISYPTAAEENEEAIAN